MNGKKAKLIRKQLKAHNAYKKEPEYQVTKHKRNVYITDPVTGTPRLQAVQKDQIINKSRFTYRRAKKAYKNGDLII